ncbi:hypothetical protein GSY74_00290, partial [Sulfurovum sp. bin170]|uniref:hypothetical protein n=1 Tax=Sulfurovum sp. bin170 TaxID=2695268 RepID=UPI001418ACCF
MKNFSKIVMSIALLSVGSWAVENITPSQLDENSKNIVSTNDIYDRIYTIYQDGNDADATYKRGQLLKHISGTNYEIVPSYISNQPNYISSYNFGQSSMKFDSNNRLHIAYIDEDEGYPMLTYQRYNPSDTNTNHGWETRDTFLNGLDKDDSELTPNVTDLAMDLNGSNIPLISYIDESNSKLYVRYLSDSGTDSDFSDDVFETLADSDGFLTTTDMDMVIDNNVPYIAYQDDTTKKLSVIKHNGSTWSLVDANISVGDATNITIYKEEDGNLYLSYLDAELSKTVVKKLRRYLPITVVEHRTEVIDISVTGATNITFSLDGDDKDKFVISNDGNLTFATAPNFASPEDNNSDNVYEVTVKVADSDSNIILEKDYNVIVTGVEDAPIINPIANISKNTNFSDFNITIDGIVDLDREDLNISFETNDTSIIRLSKNWDNNVSYADYFGNEFNLTVSSEVNRSGVTEVNLTISDGVATIYREFNITVKDMTPDSFSFTDKTSQARSTVVESNSVTVTGIDDGITISITGGEYRINGGAWTDVNGTIDNGDSVTVRLTSSSSYGTVSTATLTIGDTTESFSVKTGSAPPVVIPPSGGGDGSAPTPVEEPEEESNDIVSGDGKKDETTARFDDNMDVDIDKTEDTTIATMAIEDKKIEVAVHDSGTMEGKI